MAWLAGESVKTKGLYFTYLASAKRQIVKFADHKATCETPTGRSDPSGAPRRDQELEAYCKCGNRLAGGAQRT
jgi:hypothetical protein